MTVKKQINNSCKWDKVYKEQDPNQIPWNYEEPPEWFREVINSGWVIPCETLDVGCGLGGYSRFLAQKGFNVVGVDYSEAAIKTNKKRQPLDNLRFQTCDAMCLSSLKKNFSFVLDISLFHHIAPENRKKYVDSLVRATHRGAKFLLCCFSIMDAQFEGAEKFYGPDTDTITYVLSEQEIRYYFQNDFKIESIGYIEYGKIAKFKHNKNRGRYLVKMTRT